MIYSAEMKALALLPLFGCLIMANEAKVFSRCELAYKLQEAGMDGYEGYSLANCEFQCSPIPHFFTFSLILCPGAQTSSLQIFRTLLSLCHFSYSPYWQTISHLCVFPHLFPRFCPHTFPHVAPLSLSLKTAPDVGTDHVLTLCQGSAWRSLRVDSTQQQRMTMQMAAPTMASSRSTAVCGATITEAPLRTSATCLALVLYKSPHGATLGVG